MSFIPRALTLIILSILPAFVCFSEQTAPLQEKVINLHDIDKLLYRGNGILIIEQGPIPKVILDGSADEVANTSIVLTDHTLVVKEKRGFLDFFVLDPLPLNAQLFSKIWSPSRLKVMQTYACISSKQTIWS